MAILKKSKNPRRAAILIATLVENYFDGGIQKVVIPLQRPLSPDELDELGKLIPQKTLLYNIFQEADAPETNAYLTISGVTEGGLEKRLDPTSPLVLPRQSIGIISRLKGALIPHRKGGGVEEFVEYLIQLIDDKIVNEWISLERLGYKPYPPFLLYYKINRGIASRLYNNDGLCKEVLQRLGDYYVGKGWHDLGLRISPTNAVVVLISLISINSATHELAPDAKKEIEAELRKLNEKCRIQNIAIEWPDERWGIVDLYQRVRKELREIVPGNQGLYYYYHRK